MIIQSWLILIHEWHYQWIGWNIFFFKLGDARKCAIYFFCWGSCRSLSTQQSYGSPSFSHWAGHELGYAIQHVTCNLEKPCEKLWDVAWNMLKSIEYIAVDLVGKPTQTNQARPLGPLGPTNPSLESSPVANPVPHIPTILAWRTSGDWLVPFFRSCARCPGQKASNNAAFPTQMGKESIKSCQYHSIEALQEHWFSRKKWPI